MRSSEDRGIGLISTIQVIFIVLKFIGIIKWSWWLVLMPTIISTTVFVLYMIGWAIFIHKLNSGKDDE